LMARAEIVDFWAMVFNPSSIDRLTHTLIGAFIMGEPMPLERWAGFLLVWIALIILMTDMVVTGRATRRASPLPG
ncbi:MAG TPA: hypothetical protein PK890_11640, partial [Terrimesophilobacter sp.]|nr:hypothetical protein [Terrimesophilobacter sp.]